MVGILPVLQIVLPMLSAFPAAFFSKKLKKPFLPIIFVCLAEAVLSLLCFLSPEERLSIPFLGVYGLSLSCGGFAGVYTLVASLMWLVSTLFSPMYFKHEGVSAKYLFFWLFTLGSTVGLFLSDDLLTAFLFFELLSLSSYTWVVEEGTKEAFRAGKTYLAVAVLGGMILFMGIAMLKNLLGTLSLEELSSAAASCENETALRAAGLCVLFGFGAKAGMFPLHIWLPKAHPVAPSPSSAILSGVLTKAGVFGIIILSSKIFAASPEFGKVILLFGAITMVLGALLALSSTNLKQTLACSSVSQIGFILVGLGCGEQLSSFEEGAEASALAFSGALLHAVNHSSFKLALFLCAGVVAAKAGSLSFDDIRGFGRKKPLLLALFLLGCVGIGGVPLFNGYISKTLLHEGIVELAEISGNGIYTVLEWVFLVSGGMTVCYMAKLFTVLFIDRHPTKQKEFDNCAPLGKAATGALCLCFLFILSLCFFPTGRLLLSKSASFFGLSEAQKEFFPEFLSAKKLFSTQSLLGGGTSLLIGALLFVTVVLLLMRRKNGYRNLKPSWLDLEKNFYLPLCRAGLSVLRFLSVLFGVFDRFILPLVLFVLSFLGKIFEFFNGTLLLFGLGILRVVSILFDAADGSLLFVSRWFNPRRDRKLSPRLKIETNLGALFEKLFHRSNGIKNVERLRVTVKDTMSSLSRTLAFTMCMTCIGLCVIFIYMILF